MKSDLLWNLAKMEATNDRTVSVLTSTCRRVLTKALVLAGSGFNDSTQREEYWKIVSIIVMHVTSIGIAKTELFINLNM